MTSVPLKLRKLRADMKLEGKRVLVRIDANVPIEKGRAVDGPSGRIARVAVDLDWLAQRGARVIVLTHLGRPHGRRVAAYSVKPIAKRLSSLLGTKIDVTTGVTGKRVEQVVNRMKNGQILLLENLRFDPREEQNDVTFAKELAQLGDVYVNDAFSVCHRAHASMSALARELPAFAGHLLANEVMVMSQLERRAKEPFVLLMGGVKVETKLPVIEHLSSEVNTILLGGALATTFLCADGMEVGQSIYDREGLAIVQTLSPAIRKKIVLPEDVIVATSFRKDAKTRVVTVTKVGSRDRIVDIGPQTRELYTRIIGTAKTILWNGPFGYCEVPVFCKGTEAVAYAISKRTSAATTIVGGGDTGPVLERLKLADQFTLLSTGGGAMLAFFAGQTLPGLEPLEIKE